MTTAVEDPCQAAIDAFFSKDIGDLDDENRALRLGPGEFAIRASVKGGSFRTVRNRSRRLTHFEHHAYIVWCRTSAGPQPVRYVAQAICGQWIVAAKKGDWVRDDPCCRPCERTLDALLEIDRTPVSTAVLPVDF